VPPSAARQPKHQRRWTWAPEQQHHWGSPNRRRSLYGKQRQGHQGREETGETKPEGETEGEEEQEELIAALRRRVAIVGSFSTGKTTLAEALAERLGLPLLPEVAREVAAQGFRLDKDASPETEALIFLKQYNNELATLEFVGDRSLIDVMAYAGWVLDHQVRRKEMALWDECLRLAERRLRSSYSDVYYLPIEFPIVLDGLRPDDPGFQKDIDERIVGLLAAHGLNYVTITGTVEARLSQIEADLAGGRSS
jgi:AAA domain